MGVIEGGGGVAVIEGEGMEAMVFVVAGVLVGGSVNVDFGSGCSGETM